MCPSISAMGIAAGKSLAHAEVDPNTLHPDAAELGRDGAIVLADHAFGYPFAAISELRRQFPKALIIEDCARALGVRIAGEMPGQFSDWILFSMYKTVRGSRNGAVLLSNSALAIPAATNRGAVTLKERAGTFGPARFFYHKILSRRARFEQRPAGAEPAFEVQRGLPSELCAKRFAAELKGLDALSRMRGEIAEELTEGLEGIEGIRVVKAPAGSQSAGHFVSFAVNKGSRDQLITRLYRQGLFVIRTWDIVPGNYKSLRSTFTSPPAASKELAARMAHIPADYFLKATQRRRLLNALRVEAGSI